MMAFPGQHVLFVALALLCAAVASIYDVREHRIPNRLTGACLVIGLLLHLALGGWADFGFSALAALAGGSVFLIFFIAGGMGAGDVKLMAAVAGLTGLAPLQMILLVTVLAAGIFALVLATYHHRLRQTFKNTVLLLLHHGRQGLVPHPEFSLANAGTLRLPFALPIAAGCLAALCSVVREIRP